MINSKLHNPIIANNSQLGNAVIEKVDTASELLFSDLENSTPVVPETGRIWFNSETGIFKFANIGLNGNGENYVDEFLSRTDLRAQTVLSKVDFKDTLKVLNTDSSEQLVIDSTEKTIVIDNSESVTVTTTETIVTSPTVTANVTTTFKLTDGTNDKIIGDNTNNNLTINYADIDVIGTVTKITASESVIINDGATDKLIVDNTNDSITATYATVTTNVTDTTINASGVLELTDNTNTKIKADNAANKLTINYADTNIDGDVSVDGSMIISGDLTVGGKSSKVDVESENLSIADNVITLNSNLTTEDPRLASAVVDGEDVDHNAGIDINRGSEGVLNLIRWVESTDTSTDETLKEATAKVSIWNYEAATPAYELHQIIDSYTLGREVKDLSGTSFVGYDGESGVNYKTAIDAGATPEEASEYSFKLDADKLDNTIDTIVQKIDSDSYNTYNSVRVGETAKEGTSFTITHNLGTVFVDVKIQREDNGHWYFDVLPIEVVDNNTIIIETTESTKIRYMISAIEGFDINQSTDLVIS